MGKLDIISRKMVCIWCIVMPQSYYQAYLSKGMPRKWPWCDIKCHQKYSKRFLHLIPFLWAEYLNFVPHCKLLNLQFEIYIRKYKSLTFFKNSPQAHVWPKRTLLDATLRKKDLSLVDKENVEPLRRGKIEPFHAFDIWFFSFSLPLSTAVVIGNYNQRSFQQ